MMLPLDPAKFLPDGRQFLWSAHSLDLAKTCARKYYYASVLTYSTKIENVHARFGIEVAVANETYYKKRIEGADHTEALRFIVQQALQNTWDDDKPALQHEDLKQLSGSAHLKTRENLIRTIIWYFEQYGENDPCKTVIKQDGEAAVELDFLLHATDEITFRGRMDRIVNYADDPYVEDTKTTGSSLSSYYFERYNPDNQMSLYAVAAEVVFHTPVKGILINAMQIAVGFTRFERGLTYRTQSQSAEWLRDAEYHIKETWRAGEHGWPMRDTSCQKFGGCAFIKICSKSPEVREEFLKVGFEQKNLMEAR